VLPLQDVLHLAAKRALNTPDGQWQLDLAV